MLQAGPWLPDLCCMLNSCSEPALLALWYCKILLFFSLCLIKILIYQQVCSGGIIFSFFFFFLWFQYTYPGTDLLGEKNRIFSPAPSPGNNSLLTRTNKLLENGFLLLTCKLMPGTCYLTHPWYPAGPHHSPSSTSARSQLCPLQCFLLHYRKEAITQ